MLSDQKPAPVAYSYPSKKRTACVHVDLDSLWVIGRFHRFDGEEEPDPILHGSVPLFLDLFAEHDIRATFFITGSDAAKKGNQPIIQAILDERHEIANHSMTHPPNFNSLSTDEIQREIAESTRAIEGATGHAPKGFRAPTFNISGSVLDILEDFGYAYDSSILPTFTSPLYKISRILAGKRPFSYGRIEYFMAPMKPYHPSAKKPWKPGAMSIYEVPVSTMPLLRFPFHASYILCTTMCLFNVGFAAYRMTGGPLVYLFHARDLFNLHSDSSKRPPVSATPSARKRGIVGSIMKAINEKYQTITTSQLISNLRGAKS